MKIKNKCAIAILSLSSVFPLQPVFAHEEMDDVDVATLAADATVAQDAIQTPEQKQDAEQLRAILLLVDMEKMDALGEVGNSTNLTQVEKLQVKAALENMKEIKEKAQKLKMQSVEGKDALKKFIAFNDYNIQHIEDNSMFTGTDAEKEKMSLTIGALNQDLMQALSVLLARE